MDPNATLRELRLLVAEALNADDGEHDWPVLAAGMAELFDGLDKWLVGPGFLPEDWDWGDDT